MSLLSAIFPGWALRREAARARLALLQKARAFNAGPSDRLSGWRAKVQETINQKARRDLETTRAQARELYRHNPWAHGTVNSIVANLVGCGIKPQARVMMPRLFEPLESFNDKVDAAWQRWAQEEGFYAKQRLVQREKIVAGEVLIRFVAADDREIPLTLEVIQSERLATTESFRTRSPNVAQGIEFGDDGRPVAYWIYPHPPTTQALVQTEPERVPATEILHIFDQTEPGQIRGLTRLMTCAGTFEAMAQYLDFVLTKERVASAFALAITRQQPLSFPNSGGETTDANQNDLDYLEGGIIFHADPGEQVQGISSSVQPAQVEQLMTVLLRQTGRGLDVAYELVSRDLSKVTYLSARQGENQDRRHWKPEQEDLTHQFNRPVRRELIRLGHLAGLWRIPDGQLDRYCAAEWIPDGWDWIDPTKDITGEIEAIKAGILSPQEACAKHGRDWFQVLTDTEAHKKEAEAKGLALSIYPDLVTAADAEATAAAMPEPQPQEPSREEATGSEEASTEAA
jgi:lambda family phage portal protein